MQKLTQAQETWLTALESGRYKQTSEALRKDDAFCCLGVACDLSGLSAWRSEDNDFAYLGCSALLPGQVLERLGMTENDGAFSARDSEAFYAAARAAGYEGREHYSLVGYNDNGATFAQIAAAIRACPEAVFTTT